MNIGCHRRKSTVCYIWTSPAPDCTVQPAVERHEGQWHLRRALLKLTLKVKLTFHRSFWSSLYNSPFPEQTFHSTAMGETDSSFASCLLAWLLCRKVFLFFFSAKDRCISIWFFPAQQAMSHLPSYTNTFESPLLRPDLGPLCYCSPLRRIRIPRRMSICQNTQKVRRAQNILLTLESEGAVLRLSQVMLEKVQRCHTERTPTAGVNSRLCMKR